jgi:hypothetical protein
MTAIGGTATAPQNFDSFNIAARINDGARFMQQAARDLGAAASPVQSLLERFSNSGSAVEQGSILRSLDNASGGRANTDRLINGDVANVNTAQDAGGARGAGAKNTTAARSAPEYDAADLYGPNGPSRNDIHQSVFGDCYYVGVLAATADRQPGTIRNAISYDAKTQSFNVTLYGSNNRPQTINVTQADIRNNIAMGGGSGRDNGNATAPIWPDVMEVARAKQLDTNHRDGLTEGYTAMIHGGNATDSYRVLTGTAAKSVGFNQGMFESQSTAMDRLGSEVRTALANGRPVTMDTRAERDDRGVIDRIRGTGAITQDGLADSHTYSVASMFKDSKGEWQVTLRNPWGHNDSNKYDEGYNTTNHLITVPLSRLVNTEGLAVFDIGK